MRTKLNLWSVVTIVYLICNITFCAGNLVIINSLSMYAFLAVSAVNIIANRYIKKNSTLLYYALFGGFLLISILYSPNSPLSRQFANDTLYDYVTMFVILFCISQYLTTVERIKYVWYACFLGGITLSLYVFSMYGASFWTVLKANSSAESYNIVRIGTGFVNTNTIGIYCAMSVCIGSFLLIYSSKKRAILNILYVLAIMICFIMAMASGSKKSILMIVSFFGLLMIYKQIGTRNILTLLKYIILAVILIAILVYLLEHVAIFSGISQRMVNMFEFYKTGKGGVSDLERTSFIKNGFSYWLQSPIWGNGLGSSVYYMGMYAHNNYIEILMSTGIIGVLLYYIPILKSFGQFIKKKKLLLEEYVNVFTLGFCILGVFLITGVAAVYYFDRYWMILMYSTIALINRREEVPN